MGRQAGLWMILLVVGSSLLWLLLLTGPVQAQRGSAVSVRVAATVSPQATPTKGQPPQQGTVQNEQVPSWVTLSLLFIGCAVLLAVIGFMLWIGGLLPWHRQRQPAGWGYEVLLALLAALTAVVALAPQVFAVFTPPTWVRIVLVALAGVLALAAAVVKLRSTQREKERSWTRQVRGLLQVSLGADGKLPQLSALDPYRLGVSPSRYGSEERRGDDPYVPRIIDDMLDQALHSKRFVLVVGDSKAGKSRTAYEAATRLQQHAGRSHDPPPVLVPKSTDVLGQLLELDPPLDLHPEPALLWLDDLTESALAALTPALLERLTAQMIVLGTLTAQRHDRVMNSDSEIGSTAQLALRRATVIRLEAGLTDQERVVAEQKYPQERFKAGIGEQLVAVEQLTSRYDNARQGANPHGWALVQAAIDWTRMNVGRPIKQRELAALCPLYLNHLRAHAKHDDEEHEKALRWACQPVVSRLALLEELPSDLNGPSYVPFNYLVAAADGQGGRLPQPILDPAWDKVFALVSPEEAVRTAVSASLRQIPLRAQNIFTAVAADYSEAAPAAALNLGVLLRAHGDPEGAKAAFEQAIDSGQAEVAPAAYNLGELLEEQNDLEGAKAAYQRAIDSGHLGGLLGLLQRYSERFSQLFLDERGRARVAHFWQLLSYGSSLLRIPVGEQGNREGATAAHQRAIASGHAESAPKAAVNLGRLLQEQGDLAGAKAAYQRAIDSDHPDAAPRAAYNLGELLEEQGDLEGAKAAYQRAIDSGHPEAAPAAAVNLERLFRSTPPPAAS